MGTLAPRPHVLFGDEERHQAARDTADPSVMQQDSILHCSEDVQEVLSAFASSASEVASPSELEPPSLPPSPPASDAGDHESESESEFAFFDGDPSDCLALHSSSESNVEMAPNRGLYEVAPGVWAAKIAGMRLLVQQDSRVLPLQMLAFEECYACWAHHKNELEWNWAFANSISEEWECRVRLSILGRIMLERVIPFSPRMHFPDGPPISIQSLPREVRDMFEAVGFQSNVALQRATTPERIIEFHVILPMLLRSSHMTARVRWHLAQASARLLSIARDRTLTPNAHVRAQSRHSTSPLQGVRADSIAQADHRMADLAAPHDFSDLAEATILADLTRISEREDIFDAAVIALRRPGASREQLACAARQLAELTGVARVRRAGLRAIRAVVEGWQRPLHRGHNAALRSEFGAKAATFAFWQKRLLALYWELHPDPSAWRDAPSERASRDDAVTRADPLAMAPPDAPPPSAPPSPVDGMFAGWVQVRVCTQDRAAYHGFTDMDGELYDSGAIHEAYDPMYDPVDEYLDTWVQEFDYREAKLRDIFAYMIEPCSLGERDTHYLTLEGTALLDLDLTIQEACTWVDVGNLFWLDRDPSAQEVFFELCEHHEHAQSQAPRDLPILEAALDDVTLHDPSVGPSSSSPLAQEAIRYMRAAIRTSLGLPQDEPSTSGLRGEAPAPSDLTFHVPMRGTGSSSTTQHPQQSAQPSNPHGSALGKRAAST